MNWAILGPIVALTIFVAGLIWHAGQMAQRLAALEEWRRELREDMHHLDEKLDRIVGMIRGEER